MTDLLRAILLGALQGATEFLPVSSSGHLVVVPALLGWPEPALVFDATVHLATAAAALLYFRRDWVAMIASAARWARHPRAPVEPASRQLALLILATIPAALAGVLLNDFFAQLFQSPRAAASMLYVTAATLFLAERLARQERPLSSVNATTALGAGVAQAVAIVPGISRSGTTIAAGLVAGLQREAATRFAFLMAVPIILGAGTLELAKAALDGGAAGQAPALVAGAASAFVVGLASIGWLLSFVARRSLIPFAAYAAVAGTVALLLLS